MEPDDVAFNARVAAESEDVPYRLILESLDSSYRRLCGALDELPACYADMDDGWVEAVVTGNTCDHYAEHLRELTAASAAPPTTDGVANSTESTLPSQDCPAIAFVDRKSCLRIRPVGRAFDRHQPSASFAQIWHWAIVADATKTNYGSERRGTDERTRFARTRRRC